MTYLGQMKSIFMYFVENTMYSSIVQSCIAHAHLYKLYINISKHRISSYTKDESDKEIFNINMYDCRF